MRSALKRTSPAPELVRKYRHVESDERPREINKGLVSGLVGGLVGTIVMTAFQNGWSKASQAWKRGDGQQQQSSGDSEDATMKAAGKLAEAFGRPLSHEQKKKFGPVVHYAFGTAQGAMYGAVTELAGIQGGLVSGVSFGAALFVVADELAVPAAGLSGKPSEFPLSSHLYGLASHLVYGVTTDIVRRGLRTAL